MPMRMNDLRPSVCLRGGGGGGDGVRMRTKVRPGRRNPADDLNPIETRPRPRPLPWRPPMDPLR